MSTLKKAGSKKRTTPPGKGWRHLAELLREAVTTSELSVDYIAKKAGITRQYLYTMMSAEANPTIDILEQAFAATGQPLDRILDDKAMYGRDKPFHDRVQRILDVKGSYSHAIRTIVDNAKVGDDSK